MDITNFLVEWIAWAFFGLALIGAAACWISESRTWNGGVCRESGLPWRLFDRDSQGGRGYTDGAGNYCWFSWPSIAPNVENKGE